MAKLTIHSGLATHFILINFFINIPIRARLIDLTFKKRSFKILIIVGVNTTKFIMIYFLKRTKFRFKIKK